MPPTVFNLATASLDPGAMLLEASAGTGKTWTIAGLYARLIGEVGLSPRDILAVTFTEAATAELRERLRHRLIEVRLLLRNGLPTEDGAALALRSAIASGRLSAELADRRFTLALSAFDEAAIHTIHGFCQRLLREQAFACGTAFELELEPDGEALRQQAADDVWRRLMATSSGPSSRLAVAAGISAAALAQLHRAAARAGHEAQVITGSGGRSLAEAEADLLAAATLAVQAWQTVGEAVTALLDGHKGVSVAKGKGLPREALELHAAALTAGAADPLAPAVLQACAALAAENFTGPYQLKRHDPPEHPFFTVASRVARAHAVWLGAVRERCLAEISTRLDQITIARGVLTFDDLIGRVYAALQGPSAAELVVQVRARLRAALIDEFQDTDTRQWAIFRRLFRTAGCHLYLIGDPKQAIYRFRGADLFAYLGARAELAADPDARIFTLGHNFRSRADLVTAVNGLFEGAPVGFLGAGVEFSPVAAAAPARPQLVLGGVAAAPLYHFRLNFAGPPGADALRNALATAAATYTARLLGEGRLDPPAESGGGPVPIKPEHLAILVRTNKEAVLLEEALRARGIAALRQTDESVYATAEATELLAVLTGLREAGDDGAWRAALATRILGADAARLDALLGDDAAWALELERASRWRALWEERSFIRAFKVLLEEAGVRRRWLARPGGERALTNLLHLGELLHESARQQRLGPDALLRHLRRARQEAANGVTPEQHLLRLETDADAVQLVTVHRAKGLEYAIVLAPFHTTAVATKAGKHCAWHAPDGQPCLDLTGTPDPDAEAAALREATDDEARLLYVSLTRARLHLAIFDSALLPSRSKAGPLPQLLGEREVALIDVEDPHDFEIPGHPRLAEAAVAAGPLQTVPARSVRSIPPDPLYESFSSLASAAAAMAADPHEAEAADRDPAPVSVAIEPAAESPARERGIPSIHTLPAGARTGDALHAVLEAALAPDAAPATPLRERVIRAFQRHLLPTDHLDVTVAALRQAIEHPYPTPAGSPLRLTGLPAAARQPELAFLVPLRPVSADRLAAVLAGAPGLPHDLPRRLGALQHRLADGYLTGFLDLVVRDAAGRHHLFDWKSNRLGMDSHAYAPERLTEAMAEHLYGLQFQLYLVALARHLRRCLPDFDPARHLGEVRYVFLRGLDPAVPDQGVFTVRPEPDRLAALEALLCPPMEESP